MEKFITGEALAGLLVSLLVSLVITPLMIRFSRTLGLVDKPDHRKLHGKAIPLVGGLVILISTGIAVLVTRQASLFILQQPVIIISSIALLITGVCDDKLNIRPVYRLIIQAIASLAVALSGIRLTSFYGFMGIGELGVVWQYILTVLIITGATNAFNLVDGIDGLAGGLALINMVVMGIICFRTSNIPMLALLIAITGAVLGFLKNNIHPAKIFMGDGGSLMLGFFMTVCGIYLIENAHTVQGQDTISVVITVASTLIVPVFDSLRVYIWRIRRGESPFKADRTHLHHLFLKLGINHKKAALYIYSLEVLIVFTGFFFHDLTTISLTIILMVIIFLATGYLLQVNSDVEKWMTRIRDMENE